MGQRQNVQPHDPALDRSALVPAETALPRDGGPMTEPVDLEALAAPLRALLDAIEAGELTAGPLARSYLAGAVAALEAAASGAVLEPPNLTF